MLLKKLFEIIEPVRFSVRDCSGRCNHGFGRKKDPD